MTLMCCSDDVILGICIGIGYWYRWRPIELGIGYASWYHSNPILDRHGEFSQIEVQRILLMPFFYFLGTQMTT